jgi:hypothetical protein
VSSVERRLMVASAISGIIGAVVGVVLGVMLTARWQRIQWVEDNKRLEYRQVLDALHVYKRRLLTYFMERSRIAQPDPKVYEERLRALFDAEMAFNETLADRLFIGDVLAKANVAEDFGRFLQTFKANREKTDNANKEDAISQSRLEAHQAIHALVELHGRIVQAAEKDFKVRPHSKRFRTWFRPHNRPEIG